MIIFPNPTLTDGVLNIKAKIEENETESHLKIYDISGKIAFETTIIQADEASKIEKIFNVSDFNLKKGIYLLKLSTKTNSITKRLIIQ